MPTKTKQWGIPYWVKHRLRFQSVPENIIIAQVIAYIEGQTDAIEVAFDGEPIELLNEIYIQHRKKMGVHLGLFPTPLDVADDLADMIEVKFGDVVFDPCAGLGNLLHAARQRRAAAHGIEWQYWLPPILGKLQLNVTSGDYLDLGKPSWFTKVMVNPPYGKIAQSTDACRDFLDKLAGECRPNVRIGAILPNAYIDKVRPKSLRETLDKFDVVQRRDIREDAFKPLTSIRCEMVELRVRE